MSDPVTLRTADLADRSAAVDLIQRLNVFENGLTGDRLETRAAAEASYDRLMHRIAARQGRLVVAQAEGAEVIGLMGFIVEEDEPFIRDDVRRYGLVTELVVHEDWRGRGVGRRLLDEAERLARAAGLRRLAIGVLEANAGAARLYDAAGFGRYLRVLVKDIG